MVSAEDPFWLVGSCLLTGQTERPLASVSSCKDTNPTVRALPSWPHDLPKARLRIPFHWALGFQHMSVGGCRHAIPNRSPAVFSRLLVWRKGSRVASFTCLVGQGAGTALAASPCVLSSLMCYMAAQVSRQKPLEARSTLLLLLCSFG